MTILPIFCHEHTDTLYLCGSSDDRLCDNFVCALIIKRHSLALLWSQISVFTMYGTHQNVGSVGPANMYPPSTFRRHGNAEQVYGGPMGLTPPGTPPRTRNSSPRSVSRRRSRDDDDEPSARRDQPQRERSCEREPFATSMPSEWGARTLEVEKQLQECIEDI